MPDYPTPLPNSHRTVTHYRVEMVDHIPQKFTIRVNNLPQNPNETELNAFKDAIGNASNAGIMADTSVRETSIDSSDARAFTEPFAEVSDAAYLVFRLEGDPTQTRTFYLPAPQTELFDNSMSYLDVGNGKVQAIITAAEALFNKGLATEAAKFRYAYSKRSDLSGQVKSNYRLAKPNLVDPVGTPE